MHLSGANDALAALVHAINLPVAHTMTGKGAVAREDRLNAGLSGRYDRIANALIAGSGLLLVVGCKLGEIASKRYTVPPAGKRIIHVDIVAEETAARMDPWREAARERYESDEVPATMGRLMGELNRLMPADGILVADGGFAAHWGGLLFDTKRPGRGFLLDRGFASIGYGLPGATGAAVAAPGRAVVRLTGDGGFNMMPGELETARRLELSFAIVVVNIAASGCVEALQHLMDGPGAYHAAALAETDHARAAEALGCRGIRVEQPSGLPRALRARARGRRPHRDRPHRNPRPGQDAAGRR